ncbi:hypothetical protein BC829DRAFT_422732 [Chytridium lagenaria]|nr:hypothetical protein BC829DRAFT_422732 [Chytridium lagenaria]
MSISMESALAVKLAGMKTMMKDLEEVVKERSLKEDESVEKFIIGFLKGSMAEDVEDNDVEALKKCIEEKTSMKANNEDLETSQRAMEEGGYMGNMCSSLCCEKARRCGIFFKCEDSTHRPTRISFEPESSEFGPLSVSVFHSIVKGVMGDSCLEEGIYELSMGEVDDTDRVDGEKGVPLQVEIVSNYKSEVGVENPAVEEGASLSETDKVDLAMAKEEDEDDLVERAKGTKMKQSADGLATSSNHNQCAPACSGTFQRTRIDLDGTDAMSICTEDDSDSQTNASRESFTVEGHVQEQGVRVGPSGRDSYTSEALDTVMDVAMFAFRENRMEDVATGFNGWNRASNTAFAFSSSSKANFDNAEALRNEIMSSWKSNVPSSDLEDPVPRYSPLVQEKLSVRINKHVAYLTLPYVTKRLSSFKGSYFLNSIKRDGTKMPLSTLIVALIYISRADENRATFSEPMDIDDRHKASKENFLAALILANKTLTDYDSENFRHNYEWARVVELEELDITKRITYVRNAVTSLLQDMVYNLNVDITIIRKWNGYFRRGTDEIRRANIERKHYKMIFNGEAGTDGIL